MNTTSPIARFPQAHKLPLRTRNRLIGEVVDALQTSNAAVEKAIRILFERQTHAERQANATLENNGLGVRHNHAYRVAYYGRWVTSGRKLTGWHLDRARELAMTYSRTQLMELAALKAGLI